MEKGYVHLYTGNGKGKTTAALGMALRAAGWGKPSMIIQFMKGQEYGELRSAKIFDKLIKIEQYGSTEFCNLADDNVREHYLLARKAIERSREVIVSQEYSMVVLDEIVTAMLFKLVTLDEIIFLIMNKTAPVELVLTGRGATDPLINQCDLVTEMKEIKHYYESGIPARKGIEY